MFFKKYQLRNKILSAFLLVFIPLILLGSMIAYYQVKKIIQTGIETKLQETTEGLVNLIQTSASISIKNRLQAIAEKNLDIVGYYYSKYKSGLITKVEAIEIIEEIFLNQSIGISGYIYCLNSKGDVLIHPNEQVKGANFSNVGFVAKQMVIKDGYLEYEWQNPGELSKRAKALHMVYFKPLDWIISVSSYREEFDDLVNIDDFEEAVLATKTGKTGYSFVLNEEGTAIVHPSIQGVNILMDPEYESEFLKKILKDKNGKIEYLWQNPNETEMREKIMIFRHLPEFNWIVASSSYVEEVFVSLKTFRYFLIIVSIGLILSLIGITYLISTSITKPLTSMMDKLEKGGKGDLSIRMNADAPGEFGKLSLHFNSFMDLLEQNTKRIEKETQKNIESSTALLENELKLRGLFNQSFQYTGILSPSGIIEEANHTLLDFAGCTLKDVAYKPVWKAPWWRHDPKVQQELKQFVKKAMTGNFVRYATTCISKDNDIIHIDMSLKPVLNSLGDVAFIITEGRDISEIKLAAQDRRNLAVQLEKSQKMEAIGTLAGGIAHDFNNILSGILGYAQLADLNLGTPSKAKGHLKQISKGAHRAAELTQQILTFSRQTDFEKHPLNLYLVVKEALKLLRSSIPTTIDIRENIVSKARALADPTQMHQVIMNLCTNAYHAIGETKGVLTVKLNVVEVIDQKDMFNHKMPDDKYLKLEISDTGQGMDDATLLKVFDPYFTTKEVGKGTGLGLALVHAIIYEHDGFIKVKSKKGQGTSFFIYLPVVTGNTITNLTKKDKNPVIGGSEKIMLVDDEQDLCLIIKEILTDFGYKVSAFKNGANAFEAFEKEPDQFDLIITDMTMPKMTGGELAQKVLKLRADFPIILCTGYSETVSEAQAIEMGISQYVQKPVDNKKLLVIVRELLDRN